MTKPELHQSDLNLYEMCPESFRLIKLENRVYVSNPALARGTAIHAGREANLGQKIETQENVPLSDVTDATRDSVVKTFDENEIVLVGSDWADQSKDAACQGLIDSSTRMMTVDYSGQIEIQPTAVEITIKLELPDYPYDLGMRLDLIENGNVHDLKTSKRKPTDNAVEISHQMQLYGMGYAALYGEPARNLVLDYLVDTKSKGITAYRIAAKPDYARESALLKRIGQLHKAIEAGVFVPVSPTHWKCSPRFCQFYGTCQYTIGRSDRKDS